MTSPTRPRTVGFPGKHFREKHFRKWNALTFVVSKCQGVRNAQFLIKFYWQPQDSNDHAIRYIYPYILPKKTLTFLQDSPEAHRLIEFASGQLHSKVYKRTFITNIRSINNRHPLFSIWTFALQIQKPTEKVLTKAPLHTRPTHWSTNQRIH